MIILEPKNQEITRHALEAQLNRDERLHRRQQISANARKHIACFTSCCVCPLTCGLTTIVTVPYLYYFCWQLPNQPEPPTQEEEAQMAREGREVPSIDPFDRTMRCMGCYMDKRPPKNVCELCCTFCTPIFCVDLPDDRDFYLTAPERQEMSDRVERIDRLRGLIRSTPA